jgi:hypothetical protein
MVGVFALYLFYESAGNASNPDSVNNDEIGKSTSNLDMRNESTAKWAYSGIS